MNCLIYGRKLNIKTVPIMGVNIKVPMLMNLGFLVLSANCTLLYLHCIFHVLLNDFLL